ncbi:hypothetical protein [Streptococcus suis]|uniref:hypothetical protein n=1 Tax=Streptococcus suis TaxID=1307 RepID=UPI0009421CB9|nr:hypothetical protein [Streptococcus suis]
MKHYIKQAWIINIDTEDNKEEHDMLVVQGTPTKITLKKSDIEVDKPVSVGTFEGCSYDLNGSPDGIVLEIDKRTTRTIYMDAIESIEVSRDLELYNNQQKKIDEISKFQEKIHMSSVAALALMGIGIVPDSDATKEKAALTHEISHAIKNILNGMSAQEAINKMMEDDEEED